MKRRGAELVHGGVPMAIAGALRAMVTWSGSRDLQHAGQSKFTIHFIVELVIVTFVSALILYAGYQASLLSASLLTKDGNPFSFDLITQSDGDSGFQSSSDAKLSDTRVTFTYELGDDAPFSYALAELSFANTQQTVDLSKYSKVSLSLQCEPATDLHFSLTSVANKRRSASVDRLNRPLLEKQFFCGEVPHSVDIAFDTLNVPVWWLNFHGYEFAQSDHDLSQVVGLAIGTTRYTQKHVSHKILIDEIQFSGRDWTNLYMSFFVVVALWLIALARFTRLERYLVKTPSSQALDSDEDMIQGEKSFQALADKQASSLLSFIGKEFDNPNLNMEMAVSTLGMNKNKINAILKNEVGQTFSAYLNQLRLAASANVFSSNPHASVAEVAFAVGYNNPSYFSKLFKQHFGCSPKDFKPRPEDDLSEC